MDDNFSYPPIEPTNFDLIIVGTGLPESIIAAAASVAGKTVLHLDPNPFYGSHFTSLPIDELTSFLQSPSLNHHHQSTAESATGDYDAVDLDSRALYSNVEIRSYSDQPLDSRKFNLDLAGPRVLFCADSPVDLMLKAGTSGYVEFKSIDGSFMCDGDGNLSSVPDSRAAIFSHQNLGLLEKNRMMSFFKLVQSHLEAMGSDSTESDDNRISDEDLETPFVDFLNKMRLSSKIKSIFLYAIAMADYDQDNYDNCKVLLKTKDGIDRLALYHSSVGRFPNALGAMIYPIYGEGEVPQAFCRRAAVKGCLYVLRMPVIALLLDKGSGSYRGVKLSSGQDLFSHQLVLDPSYKIPLPLANITPDILQSGSGVHGPRDVNGKVARGICIVNSSLKSDKSNVLVIYPPKSLNAEQVTSIRVLQIASNLAACPSGMFVLYLSTLCDDANQGKELVTKAINALVSIPIYGDEGKKSTDQVEDEESKENSTDHVEDEESKPSLLWSAFYVQELTEGSFGVISSTFMPDGDLSYNSTLNATFKLLGKMYPNEEFFPKEEAAANEVEDNDM